MPTDVAALQPDFLISVGYKWLLGPFSVGYLYVADQHRGTEPIEQNWIGRAGSEDFARLVDYRDEYQPGARRFDVGHRISIRATETSTGSSARSRPPSALRPLRREVAAAERDHAERRQRRPTTASHTSGAAVKSAAGSCGTCLNGETSSTQPGRLSSGPRTVSTTQAPSTPQAATTARGASPNSATAAPTTTHTS